MLPILKLRTIFTLPLYFLLALTLWHLFPLQRPAGKKSFRRLLSPEKKKKKKNSRPLSPPSHFETVKLHSHLAGLITKSPFSESELLCSQPSSYTKYGVSVPSWGSGPDPFWNILLLMSVTVNDDSSTTSSPLLIWRHGTWNKQAMWNRRSIMSGRS